MQLHGDDCQTLPWSQSLHRSQDQQWVLLLALYCVWGLSITSNCKMMRMMMMMMLIITVVFDDNYNKVIRYLGFMGTPFFFFFFFFVNCLVGCLSMIVWTPAVLGVLIMRMCLYFCTCTCSAHGKALQKYAHYYYCYYSTVLLITILKRVVVMCDCSSSVSVWPCVIVVISYSTFSCRAHRLLWA